MMPAAPADVLPLVPPAPASCELPPATAPLPPAPSPALPDAEGTHVHKPELESHEYPETQPLNVQSPAAHTPAREHVWFVAHCSGRVQPFEDGLSEMQSPVRSSQK